MPGREGHDAWPPVTTIWQVAPQGGDGQQMPPGMEHYSWWLGQGHTQAHRSCCLQNTVFHELGAGGRVSSWRGRVSPLPRFLIHHSVHTSLTTSVG